MTPHPAPGGLPPGGAPATSGLPAGWTLRAATVGDATALQALQGRPVTLPAAAEPAAAAHRLWVVVDPAGQLRACGRLRGRTGLDEPRCLFHVGQVVHAAPELQLFKTQRTLLLGHDLTGWAELSELAAAPMEAQATRAALCAVIQAATTLVEADPPTWGPGLLAELPGIGGQEADAGIEGAPFWHGLARHFHPGDPDEAAARLGAAWRSHLATLLPRQLIYASFLPDEAQAAIGREAPAATPLRQALEACGWRWRQHIRVDDGGPVMER